MIANLKGKLVASKESSLLVEVNGLGYEVLVPLTVLTEMKSAAAGDEISLVTYHYYSTDPSKSVPVLIGFINEIEKEFFEKFITVSGIGPKAALRAINKPISEIARAIDAADINFLKSLPGIGEQRAREIIAKLQNKIGKFGLIQDAAAAMPQASSKKDIEDEAMQILMQLQYKKQQAQEMIKKALEKNPSPSGSEELLNDIWRQKKMTGK